MAPDVDWQVTPAFQPDPKDYAFDLDAALAAVVTLKSTVPADAFTAGILGTERSGFGVLIERRGLVLTIGYLITEAETIWLGLSDGRTVPGHALGYDQSTGFGLVQALARLDVPALPLGKSRALDIGTEIIVAGAGGRQHATAAILVGKQEFAGYWEYLLDEALFTAPAHPFWGGAALIGPAGDLCGIASLRLDQSNEGASGGSEQLNMIVPIDLLSPILEDLKTLGRPKTPPRPWLGLYAVEVDGLDARRILPQPLGAGRRGDHRSAHGLS
jgi:S1-C subfamily serine protease